MRSINAGTAASNLRGVRTAAQSISDPAIEKALGGVR